MSAEEEIKHCPHCKNELIELLVTRSVKLSRYYNSWIEKDVYESTIACPICDEELAGYDISDFNIGGI